MSMGRVDVSSPSGEVIILVGVLKMVDVWVGDIFGEKPGATQCSQMTGYAAWVAAFTMNEWMISQRDSGATLVEAVGIISWRLSLAVPNPSP